MQKRRHKKKNGLLSLLIIIVFVLVLALLIKGAVGRLRNAADESNLNTETEKNEPAGFFKSPWLLVPNGEGGTYVVRRASSLKENTLNAEAFSGDGNYMYYTDDAYTVLQGVDVSFYQGNIDWYQVKNAGISFAMIRAGYRGYQSGSLQVDEKFYQNLNGALAAGLDVGVYFYSQAVTPEEAAEEANFVLQLIEGYEITFPIAFDWEHISDDTARTDDVSGDVLTDCCLAFCDTIRNAGYDPMVYFYRSLGYHEYDMNRLQGLDFWFSGTGAYPDYYYEIAMWQYSYTATVPGIQTNTDLNLYFIRNE